MKHTGWDKYRISFLKPVAAGFNIKIKFPFFHYEEFSFRMTVKIQSIIKIRIYYSMMQGKRTGPGFVYDVFRMQRFGSFHILHDIEKSKIVQVENINIQDFPRA